MAGTISRIRLENFMCHSSLDIELGQHVNFITGQNGSGKSAILTALCIAFGCRAKNTQRAATLKDFIKTGCRSLAIAHDTNNRQNFLPENLLGSFLDNATAVCSREKNRDDRTYQKT
uniref:Rad50/SbcC-type AAA domain-containing protein n=1 Tax=Aegilops tauschii subsp. strangulata TaxID=200361 RepID=A0A453MXJ0_AEGTS